MQDIELMNKTYQILSTRQENYMMFDLRLLRFFEQYEAGEVHVNQELLDACVRKVIEEKPNMNDFREEQIGEIFQVENYVQERLLLELIYYIAGRQVAKDASKVTLQDLDEWGDCVMQHGFYIGFNLNQKEIDRLINEARTLPHYYLSNVSDVNMRNAEFVKYCKDNFGDELSEDEILGNLNIYNDGAYTALPESIDTILYYCIKNEYYDLWLRIYEELEYAPIQGALIYAVKTIEYGLSLIDAENTKPVKRRKVFASLMRKRIFRLFIEQQESLENNAKNEFIIAEYPKEADDALHIWCKNKHDYIRHFTEALLLPTFTLDELLLWLSNKTYYASSKKGQYKQREIELINQIDEIVRTHHGMAEVNIEKMKLKDLFYYVSHEDITKLTTATCDQLISLICEHIYTEDGMYISWSFDDESLSTMRAVYSCFKKSASKDIDKGASYIVRSEGYKSSCNQNIRLLRGQNLWLSIMMTGLENNVNVDEFRQRTELLFKYAHMCDYDIIDYFLLPFLISEAIVIDYIQKTDEALNALKDAFEERLIATINDLIFVLCVLTQNEGQISQTNRDKLKERINKEWKITKSMNPYNPNIRFCDEYIDKYLK